MHFTKTQGYLRQQMVWQQSYALESSQVSV